MDREYRVVCPNGATSVAYSDLADLTLNWRAETEGHLDHDSDQHRIEFREVSQWFTLTKESTT